MPLFFINTKIVFNVSFKIFKPNGNTHIAMLELVGENFTPNIKVWFDDVEADTAFRSHSSIICVIPDISMIDKSRYLDPNSLSDKPGGWSSTKREYVPVEVVLSLVRNDGVIYNTGLIFKYKPEPS
jgi:recombining binding protein (suppressor of hairless)